jgi:hypothetical protein
MNVYTNVMNITEKNVSVVTGKRNAGSMNTVRRKNNSSRNVRSRTKLVSMLYYNYNMNIYIMLIICDSAEKVDHPA